MRYKRRCTILLPMVLGVLLLCVVVGCSNDASEGSGQVDQGGGALGLSPEAFVMGPQQGLNDPEN